MRAMDETYKLAGIDVHKSMLAVVVTDAAAEGEVRFTRRKFGTVDSELRALAAWLADQQVQEAVMAVSYTHLTLPTILRV